MAGMCRLFDDRRTLMTRWILNQPVVLYRKDDGTAVAVEGAARTGTSRSATAS